MTGGRGPDHCIDAVGMEGHAPGLEGAYDTVKTNLLHGDGSATGAASGDPGVPQRRHRVGRRRLRRVHRQVPDGRDREPLADHPLGPDATCSATCVRCSSGSSNGEIDPSFVISHRLPLRDAPQGYEMFMNKEDNCLKVVLKP